MKKISKKNAITAYKVFNPDWNKFTQITGITEARQA